ncbi:MAG: hypothetical protein ACLFPQ_05250 [Candidatus Woesearchaeota archaeon]
MAKISIENIDEIKVNVIPVERRFDSEGELAIDERIRQIYEDNNYDLRPKTSEEADARGEKHFNGLMSSAPKIQSYPVNGKNFVTVDIAPTRYLISQAMRDYVKENEVSEKEVQKISPDMTGVSLIVPVKINGDYYLLSQVKGKALGSGQIHAGLVAGNVDAKYLNQPDPLITTLQNECSEELGLNLSYLDSTSFIFLIDERETGQVNFASVAMNADVQEILTAYESMTRQKLKKDEKLEVMGLANLPVAGISLTPLENGSSGVKDITCYMPSSEGLVKLVEERGVRPYTSATIDYVSEPKNTRFLLEKAGY